MRIPFRQGIVQYKHPTFLQVDFPYVNLVADVSAPLIMTLAAGQTDYLHAEKANISHAWGPIAIGIDTWLYIDIDTRTAQRTFGSTALEPISGANPPISPAADQHWFDTTSNNLKVWTGTAWIEKIRVFACMLQGGQVPVSMSINSPDFAGTQVGNLTSISAGYILFDTNNAPIKTSNNTFITSEDSLRVNSLSASDVKVGSLIVEAISTGNIPAFSVVEFSDFGKITIASTFVTTTRKQYGIIQKSVVTGEAVNVSIDGPITNLDWDWSAEGVNAYLFNDVNGNLVSSPAVAEQPPVAIVVDRHTIMLLVKVIITNLPPPLATTSTAGIVKMATSPASPSNPVVVGDNDPRLTNARIPVDHEHHISDIVDLQTTLDALESDKLNIAGGTLTGSSLTTPSEKILQTLYSCGYDGWAGQLGNSTVFNSKSSPVQIGTRTDWKQLAGGANSTVALKTDGTLWGWGENGTGQLGLGHTNQRSSPTQIGTKNNWKFVSGGWYVTYAVDLSGQLWACGDNYYGQVGDGSTTNTSTLTQIGTLTNWANVSGGRYHAAAIKNDGSLWTWGANDFGQLGLSNITNKSSPTQVGSLNTWKQVVCGEYFTAAVKTDGTLWAWGSDNAGSLGQNGVLTNRSSPIQVGALTNWKQISAGPVGVIATKTDGTMWAWGYNNFGQLGVGNTTSRSSPTQIGSLTTWRKAVMSNVGEFAGAIKTDGTLWTWGRNANGQLGSNTTTHRSSPVQVGGLNGWVDLQMNYLTMHALLNTVPYIGSVAYASTVNLDWSVSDVIRITYAGTAMTVNSMIPPPRDGQICTLELTTNATNNTCTFAASANVRFSSTIASYTPTTTASRKDRITFLYDGSTNKFDVISVNKGFV